MGLCSNRIPRPTSQITSEVTGTRRYPFPLPFFPPCFANGLLSNLKAKKSLPLNPAYVKSRSDRKYIAASGILQKKLTDAKSVGRQLNTLFYLRPYHIILTLSSLPVGTYLSPLCYRNSPSNPGFRSATAFSSPRSRINSQSQQQLHCNQQSKAESSTNFISSQE